MQGADNVLLWALAAFSGGYLLGFVAHHLSRCAKTPHLVIVTPGCLPKEAGALLRKAATAIERWKPGIVLSGLVFKGGGAVYTPESEVRNITTRFLAAAHLCDELENAFLKEYGNQSPDDWGPDPLPVGKVETNESSR